MATTSEPRLRGGDEHDAHRRVIRELFEAFGRRDAQAMIRCYNDKATFRDPVFCELARPEIAKMWEMLCGRGKDLQIELQSVHADETSGSAEWVARYTFQKTGRHVENRVRSTFRFEDGLIASQDDHFDFWRWATMALGLPGRVLGWSPLVKGAVRKEAKQSLAAHGRSREAAAAR